MKKMWFQKFFIFLKNTSIITIFSKFDLKIFFFFLSFELGKILKDYRSWGNFNINQKGLKQRTRIRKEVRGEQRSQAKWGRRKSPTSCDK